MQHWQNAREGNVWGTLGKPFIAVQNGFRGHLEEEGHCIEGEQIEAVEHAHHNEDETTNFVELLQEELMEDAVRKRVCASDNGGRPVGLALGLGMGGAS